MTTVCDPPAVRRSATVERGVIMGSGNPAKKPASGAKQEPSVVDRVLAEFCEGNLSEMARQLTLRTQRYVSRQQVFG